MPAITSLGDKSRTYILYDESHKLSLTFTVATAAVVKGHPVKLNAAGTVSPWVNTDTTAALVGITLNPAAIGEETTIRARGFIVVFALSGSAHPAGPITINSYNAAKVGPDGQTGWLICDDMADAATTAAQQAGWALDQATAADQLIRVLIMN